MKVRDILRELKAQGWYLHATKGSHRQLKHPVKSGKITVPGHLKDELRPGTLRSINRQASWEG